MYFICWNYWLPNPEAVPARWLHGAQNLLSQRARAPAVVAKLIIDDGRNKIVYKGVRQMVLGYISPYTHGSADNN